MKIGAPVRESSRSESVLSWMYWPTTRTNSGRDSWYSSVARSTRPTFTRLPSVRRFTCCFFFSSRRRHTRSDRDWSSDVCSSDLTRPRDAAEIDTGCSSETTEEAVVFVRDRSEERRVGKECKYRSAQDD